MEIGIEQGVEIGMQKGVEWSNHLTRILLEQGRTEELKRALGDTAYQQKLFHEIGLQQDMESESK